jgi:hypothetical protein
MKQFYYICEGGKFTVTETIANESDPLTQEAKALAEAHPSRVVVGWQATGQGEVKAKQVEFLDKLGG